MTNVEVHKRVVSRHTEVHEGFKVEHKYVHCEQPNYANRCKFMQHFSLTTDG